MGISRDMLHKRRATGGRRKRIRMKRKFELGRAPSNTKLGSEKKIHLVRTRGGHVKHRALVLDHGNFCWPGEAVAKKTRIMNVSYNATSNELVRTNTLVKGAIVQVDGTPFKQWYEKFYGIAPTPTVKGKEDEKEAPKKDASATPTPTSTPSTSTPAPASGDKKKKKDTVSHAKRIRLARVKARVLDLSIADQFKTGRLYARITSRPGQCGRADGYILEGDELAFYLKKIIKKKK